jgi:hypothetical protein
MKVMFIWDVMSCSVIKHQCLFTRLHGLLQGNYNLYDIISSNFSSLSFCNVNKMKCVIYFFIYLFIYFC